MQGGVDAAARAADLRQRGAGLGHGGVQVGHAQVAVAALGEAKVVVRVDILGPENGRVGLRLVVLADIGNGGALDAQRGAVAALVAAKDGDFAVAGNQRGGDESGDEDLSEHFVVDEI